MYQGKKYDVFISSKSEDYPLAEDVYDFLTKNGLSVFIASKELKKIGESKYSDTIDEVLDNSDHLIVVSSSLDNIKSKWVKHEWSTFSDDLKSGYKNGNLLTILNESIELKTLPASLRHQQSFSLHSYKKEILGYLPVLHQDNKRMENDQIDSTLNSVALFKFYSNENCEIILDGTTVVNLIGMSDKPFCLYMTRKGDYRFKCVNSFTKESKILKEHIDENEEKEIDIQWESHVCIDSIPTTQKSYFSTSKAVNLVLSGPQSFVFGDTIEIKVDTPVNKAVWEIYCGTECLYKSNTITTNKVLKLYENEAKIRFIMNSQVSKVYKDKTEQLKVRYFQYDNQSICAELTLDKYSHKGNVFYGYTKSSSPSNVNEGIANKISAPILIGPKQNYFVYYETIVINVQNPVKKAVWEIYTDSSCAYKSNSINPVWGEKVIIKEFESNEKIRFKIARTIGDGYSYSAQKVLIRYYQSDNQNLSSELTLAALN